MMTALQGMQYGDGLFAIGRRNLGQVFHQRGIFLLCHMSLLQKLPRQIDLAGNIHLNPVRRWRRLCGFFGRCGYLDRGGPALL